MNEILCMCGHPYSWHERLAHHGHIDCCVGCADVIGLNAEEAGAYHFYIQDNLSYIEQEAKARGLV